MPSRCGVKPIRAKLHQADELLAEEGPGGDITLAIGRHLGLDHGAEIAGVGRDFLGDRDSAVLGKDLSVDKVDLFFKRRFEPARGEAGGDQAGVFVSDLAPVPDGGVLGRAAVHLGVEHAKASGQVKVEAMLVELGAIERGHVHGEPDLAALEEVDQKSRRLDRHADLRLLGRRSQVRRDQDAGMIDQGMPCGGRFRIKHVDRGAGDLARVERGGQRRLVDQAARAQLMIRTPGFILASAAGPTTLRVSSESGVCKVM